MARMIMAISTSRIGNFQSRLHRNFAFPATRIMVFVGLGRHLARHIRPRTPQQQEPPGSGILSHREVESSRLAEAGLIVGKAQAGLAVLGIAMTLLAGA